MLDWAYVKVKQHTAYEEGGGGGGSYIDWQAAATPHNTDKTSALVAYGLIDSMHITLMLADIPIGFF